MWSTRAPRASCIAAVVLTALACVSFIACTQRDAQAQARQVSRISADGKRSDFATNLDEPREPAFDSRGNLYVAETLAGRILVYAGSF